MPSDTPQHIAASCLAMRARRLARGVSRLYEAELGDLGLSAGRFNVLVAIAANPGVQAHALTGPLDLEKSSLSRTLARLIDDGLVASEPTGQGRGAALQATPAGLDLLERARPAWERAQVQAEAALGPLAELLLDHQP